MVNSSFAREAWDGKIWEKVVGDGSCADNVTKTSKCTTPAHLFAKSRGRMEKRGEEVQWAPIYRHLPNDFRPWQNRLIKSSFRGKCCLCHAIDCRGRKIASLRVFKFNLAWIFCAVFLFFIFNKIYQTPVYLCFAINNIHVTNKY